MITEGYLVQHNQKKNTSTMNVTEIHVQGNWSLFLVNFFWLFFRYSFPSVIVYMGMTLRDRRRIHSLSHKWQLNPQTEENYGKHFGMGPSLLFQITKRGEEIILLVWQDSVYLKIKIVLIFLMFLLDYHKGNNNKSCHTGVGSSYL